MRKGGITIQKESDKIEYVPVVTSVITSSGSLSCKGIIDLVGPHMGERNEDYKLRKAICNCLDICAKAGFKSISIPAIPAISTKIFGFPKEIYKYISSEELYYLTRDGTPSTKINLIEFCFVNNVTLDFFDREFSNIKRKMDYIFFLGKVRTCSIL